MDEPFAYALDPHYYNVLRVINKRLYENGVIEGDEKRDLANLMAYMISNFEPLREEDLVHGGPK